MVQGKFAHVLICCCMCLCQPRTVLNFLSLQEESTAQVSSVELFLVVLWYWVSYCVLYVSLKVLNKVFQQRPKHSCMDGLEKHEGPGPCGQHCHGGVVLVGTWSVKQQHWCCKSVAFYKLRVTKTAELGSKASWA